MFIFFRDLELRPGSTVCVLQTDSHALSLDDATCSPARGHGVAFAPAQGGCRQAAVDQRGRARGAGDIHIGAADGQVKGVAAKRGGAGLAVCPRVCWFRSRLVC